MRKIFLILVVCLLLVPSVVWAVTYNFYVPIRVTNNGSNNISGIGVWVAVNNTQLVDLGYISASGLDTDLRDDSGEVPSMVAGDRLAFFIEDLDVGDNITYNYRLGLDPARTDMPVITGYGGNVTIADNPALEPGDTFMFLFGGWVPSGSVGRILLYKEGALCMNITDVGEVTFTILGGAPTSVTATGISVGYHLVYTWADGVNLYILVE